MNSQLVFGIILGIMTIILLVGVVSFFTHDPLRKKCIGMGGDRYSISEGVAYCSRKPFMRNPKLLFKEKVD